MKNKYTAPATLLSCFLVANNIMAQDVTGDNSQKLQSNNISTLLQDYTDSPFAGGPIHLRVCTTDGLDKTHCDVSEIILPLPKFNNPLSREVQLLRRALAVAVESADRNSDNQPIPRSVYNNTINVTGYFEAMFDKHSTAFQNPETLMKVMDMHYDLVSIEETPSLEFLEGKISALRVITLQLENDLLSKAERELRDAQEALQKALEEGASSEEIEALNEALTEALEGYIDEKQQDKSLSPSEQKALEEMQDMMKALKEILEELGITPEEYAQMLMNGMNNSSPSGAPPSSGESEKMSYEEMLEALREKIKMMQKMQKYIQSLKDIIEEQETLRNDTLTLTLRSQNGLSNQDRKLLNKYSVQQEELAERTQNIAKDMAADNIPVDTLDAAKEEMNNAKDSLKITRPGEAVEYMDKALEALKQANEDSQQMLMMMPGSGGPMSGDSPGGSEADLLSDTNKNVIEDGVDKSIIEQLNQSLDINTGEASAAKNIRNEIIRRQENQGNNSYLDKLLKGP